MRTRSLLLALTLVACAWPAAAQVPFGVNPATLAPPVVFTSTTTSMVFASSGSVGAPSIAFAAEPTMGFYRPSAGNVVFVGTLSATTGLASGANMAVTAAGAYSWNSVTRSAIRSSSDGIMSMENVASTIGSKFKVDALPTVNAGFGTSPGITAGSTPFAGSVNVGTGGVATTGTIDFNGTAFPSAPFCALSTTTATYTAITAISTTQLTLTGAAAWPGSTVISWVCVSAK
jgi:hypothetical protein